MIKLVDAIARLSARRPMLDAGVPDGTYGRVRSPDSSSRASRSPNTALASEQGGDPDPAAAPDDCVRSRKGLYLRGPAGGRLRTSANPSSAAPVLGGGRSPACWARLVRARPVPVWFPAAAAACARLHPTNPPTGAKNVLDETRVPLSPRVRDESVEADLRVASRCAKILGDGLSPPLDSGSCAPCDRRLGIPRNHTGILRTKSASSGSIFEPT
jgi:hypothetical protein